METIAEARKRLEKYYQLKHPRVCKWIRDIWVREDLKKQFPQLEEEL